jgi:hypothetical protein
MARVKALTDRIIAERFAESRRRPSSGATLPPKRSIWPRASWARPWRTSFNIAFRPGGTNGREVPFGCRNGGYWRTVASRWRVLDVFKPRVAHSAHRRSWDASSTAKLRSIH